MNVWVVLYDEADEPADVMVVCATKEEADAYVEDVEDDGQGNLYNTLCVQGPFEVRGT
jgi:hypothetical protein